MLGKRFEDLLEVCRRRKFLEFVTQENSIFISKYSQLYEFLRSNVINEWKTQRNPKISNFLLESVRSTKDFEDLSYFKKDYFVENVDRFKQKTSLPFSISEVLEGSTKIGQNNKNSEEKLVQVNVDKRTVLRTSYFVKESLCKETLYQIQRQHKIKWMKYSVNPQKYFISDQKVEEFEGIPVNYVLINSNWEPEKTLQLEKIRMFPLKSFLESDSLSQTYKFSRKKEIPWIIQSLSCLETATLNMILDAIETSSENIFKFHRRLAPYQISILKQDPLNESLGSDLIDLSRYIELLIKKEDKHIKILNSSSNKIVDDKLLKKELEEIDKSIGIPYTLVLNENTLKTGLLKLRNRNTTLSETIHISDIPQYIVKIFNSY